jgi:MFS family permease
MSLNNGTAASRPAARAARTPGYAGTLAAACFAVLVAQIANALPASLNGLLQQDLHTQGTQLTWITAAFMVVVVVFEFSFGVLGDLYGRKRLVAGGALLVAIGSAVFALAPSVQVVWVGAAISGLGAGAMFPGSLALVATTTHTAAARARSIAIWSGCLAAGAGISPLLGGVLASAGSWRASLWVEAGLAVVALLVTVLFSAESAAPEGRGLDIAGQILFAVGLFAVLYAAVQGPADGWAHANVLAGFVVGAALLIAFVAIERRATSPILNLHLFKNRAFSVTNLIAVISMFEVIGTCYANSMWLGPVQHQSAMRVGLVFLLLQGPPFLLIPVTGKLLQKVAPQWLLTAGILLTTAGALLDATTLQITQTSLTPFLLPALLVGVGFGFSVNSFTAVALNTVPLHLAGMASATTNMFRDLGFALGPILVGAVALSQAGTKFMAALPTSGLPVSQLGPATGIGKVAGPIAIDSLPPGVPGSGAHLIALQALGSGFSVAFWVCGIAGLVAAVITVAGMAGVKTANPTAESLVDPLHDGTPAQGTPVQAA